MPESLLIDVLVRFWHKKWNWKICNMLICGMYSQCGDIPKSLSFYAGFSLIWGILRIYKYFQFKREGGKKKHHQTFCLSLIHLLTTLYTPHSHAFLVNTFLAIKLQAAPEHRLGKCTGGKKQAANWPKKLRALRSREAGGDCFQCVLNKSLPTRKSSAERGGDHIQRILPGYP